MKLLVAVDCKCYCWWLGYSIIQGLGSAEIGPGFLEINFSGRHIWFTCVLFHLWL